MTVQQLIRALADYPADLEVVLPIITQSVTPSFDLLNPSMLKSARTEINVYGDAVGLWNEDDWDENEEECVYPGDNCLVISIY